MYEYRLLFCTDDLFCIFFILEFYESGAGEAMCRRGPDGVGHVRVNIKTLNRWRCRIARGFSVFYFSSNRKRAKFRRLLFHIRFL